MKLPTILATALLATAVSSGCNQAASSSSQQANNKKPNENQTTAQKQEKEAARISLADAKAAFDAGSAVFVDTRDVDSYNSGHIKGAIQMRAQDVETRYKELPANKKIIAYCSWPDEHTSARAVQILNQKGISNAAALLGGTQAWQKAGYPMEKSDKK